MFFTDDDDSTVNKISRNEKKELELELKKKEDILRKLKLVKMFRTKVCMGNFYLQLEM